MFRNPADILNYGGIKCYPVYWVRTRGRVVAGSKYYLNKNKNNKNKKKILRGNDGKAEGLIMKALSHSMRTFACIVSTFMDQ